MSATSCTCAHGGRGAQLRRHGITGGPARATTRAGGRARARVVAGGLGCRRGRGVRAEQDAWRRASAQGLCGRRGWQARVGKAGGWGRGGAAAHAVGVVLLVEGKRSSAEAAATSCTCTHGVVGGRNRRAWANMAGGTGGRRGVVHRAVARSALRAAVPAHEGMGSKAIERAVSKQGARRRAGRQGRRSAPTSWPSHRWRASGGLLEAEVGCQAHFRSFPTGVASRQWAHTTSPFFRISFLLLHLICGTDQATRRLNRLRVLPNLVLTNSVER